MVKGEWALGHLYFLLHVRSLARTRPYQATIIYGAERAGSPPQLQQAGSIGSYWLDTFGGAGPVKTTGRATESGFSVAYDFGDSIYANRFERSGVGWVWTIMEQQPGKPEKLFAVYHLNPTKCGGTQFRF